MKINFEIVLAYIICCAMLITATLFFVDEGMYSFAWMKSAGGWLVFFIYTLILSVIFGVVALLFRFILLQLHKVKK